MTNRYPLIINAASSQIQELASGDTLDLTSSGIGNLAIGNLNLTGGTSGQYISTDGAGNLSFATVSISPAGSNTQIQYNNNGTLAGSANLIFDNSSNTLTATNIVPSNNITLKKFGETVVAGGSTGAATLTPDASAGSIYTYTVTGAITLSALSNAVAGTSMTIILTQGGAGSYVLTSTMKFAGGSKTLSTAIGAIDIISVFYDGSTYYASLTKGYA